MKKTLAAFVAILFVPTLFSTDDLDINDLTQKRVESRPKTALVLSGGGARGAAHVGVLKVLEELKVPIDMVVGTSMGSIVGGFYSAGYSPDELEALIRDLDWDAALADRPARELISYRRKQDDRDYMFGVEVGFNEGKFTIPEGLIAGQDLDFILKTNLLRAGYVPSFDRLPIPFRAVATDIETGELVELANGDLAQAIRASMSVPGVFTPANINGRKLVDGGLVSNLPVQVARSMGADRIIAVDIGSGLMGEDELGSVLGVTIQMINVLIQQNIDNSIAALQVGDVYLRPDLGDFSSADFAEAYTVIPNGYAEASSRRITLSQFAVSDEEYATWLRNQRRNIQDLPTIDFFEVVGNERVAEQQILARVDHPVSKKLNTSVLNRDLERIYAIGDFETVNYDLIKKTDGRIGVIIKVNEKPWGPHYIRAGLRLFDDFEGGSQYNIGVVHRLTQINDLGAEWRNELEIGQQRRLFTEFYQPFRYDGRFFVSPIFEVSEVTRNVFTDGIRVGEFRVDQALASLDLGWTPQNDSEVRLGVEYRKLKAKPRIGDTTVLQDVEADQGGFRLQAGVDRLDAAYFPRDGWQASLDVRVYRDFLGSDLEYNLAQATFNRVWSRSSGTYGFGVELGSSFDSDAPIYDGFSLGGFARLSGLERDALTGQHYGLMNVFYYRSLGDSIPGNIGISLEGGNTWQVSDDAGFDDLVYSGAIFYSLDSFVGPLYISYGWADNSDRAFNLSLGQPF